MEPADRRTDADLVSAMVADETAATQAFKNRHAKLLYRICHSATPNERSAIQAYNDLLSAKEFSSLFSEFDGVCSFGTFVVGTVNRFLFRRLMRLINDDPLASAAEFEAFFRASIVKSIRRVIQDDDLEKDAVQWIIEQLLRNECAQLKLWASNAQSLGYIISKLRYLAKDFLNSRDAPAQGRKRSLPECLKTISTFEQDVFKQFYWWKASSAQIAALGIRHRYPEVTEHSVVEARVKVEAVLTANGGLFIVDRQTDAIRDNDASETQAAKSEGSPFEGSEDTESSGQASYSSAGDPFEGNERAGFREALYSAAKGLLPREKLYLLKLLQEKPARTIAQEMRLPVQEIYALGRRALQKLRQSLSVDPAARTLIASVTGKDEYLEDGSMLTGKTNKRQTKRISDHE